MARGKFSRFRSTWACWSMASSTKALVGKLGLQAAAHGEGEVELVHREVDPPELHVGFLEELAADLAGPLEDLLAHDRGPRRT